MGFKSSTWCFQKGWKAQQFGMEKYPVNDSDLKHEQIPSWCEMAFQKSYSFEKPVLMPATLVESTTTKPVSRPKYLVLYPNTGMLLEINRTGKMLPISSAGRMYCMCQLDVDMFVFFTRSFTKPGVGRTFPGKIFLKFESNDITIPQIAPGKSRLLLVAKSVKLEALALWTLGTGVVSV
ncbi:hypothetical protein llap_5430 [Limosa lapponica baueri]|uniref:Uncharacterized protein n=1 Tax=Limosa lapponica baueri TaxID=1758121 RepID=A0A2I0UE02_LIMLA|nr:hypothetical protein llap_5430 [Limosa lapponica baueri]